MRILVVDDDQACGQFLALLLEDEGYTVKMATGAQQALDIAETFLPDVLVADWLLKDSMDGTEVASILLGRSPRLAIFFTTGSPAQQLAEQLGNLPGAQILEKPIEIDSLLAQLKRMEFGQAPAMHD